MMDCDITDSEKHKVSDISGEHACVHSINHFMVLKREGQKDKDASCLTIDY